MPRLSIVIPAPHSVESLEHTVLSVLESRPRNCEVLVVLSRPYDDPYQLRDELRLIDAGPNAGWVECANRGIRETGSPVVHLLSAGCRVQEGWADAALGAIANPKFAAVSPLLVDGAKTTQALAAGVSCTSGGQRRLIVPTAGDAKLPPLGPSRLAGFYRKQALEAAGGFCPLVGDSLADVDLACTLQAIGLATAHEPGSRVLVDEFPPATHGPLLSSIYAERLFWRHAPQIGWLRALACHPWVVAAELLRGTTKLTAPLQLAGRLWGMCDVGRARRHQAWIHHSAARLRGAATLPIDGAGRAPTRQITVELRAKAS